MGTLRYFLFALSFGLTLAVAHAEETLFPRSPDQLVGYRGERTVGKAVAYRVRGARVAYVNYAALKRDFPELASWSNDRIDSWIVESFAYVSAEQLRLTGIRNTEIPLERDARGNLIPKDDYRPEGYHRAGVLEANIDGKRAGLVDLKGLGWASPYSRYVSRQIAEYQSILQIQDPIERQRRLDGLRLSAHSDGVIKFGEAVAELTRETAVRRFEQIQNAKDGADFHTVESYFVLELPFWVITEGGKLDRAALYGRQASWRGDGEPAVPSHLLREPKGGAPQETVTHAIVDFGTPILDQDPRLAANFGGADDPYLTHAWAWAFDTAKAFEGGDTPALYRHLGDMVRPLDEAWKKVDPEAVHSPQLREALALTQRARRNEFDTPQSWGTFVAALEKARNPWVIETALAHLSPANLRRLAEDPRFKSWPYHVVHPDPELFVKLLESPDEARRAIAFCFLPKEGATPEIVDKLARLERSDTRLGPISSRALSAMADHFHERGPTPDQAKTLEHLAAYLRQRLTRKEETHGRDEYDLGQERWRTAVQLERALRSLEKVDPEWMQREGTPSYRALASYFSAIWRERLTNFQRFAAPEHLEAVAGHLPSQEALNVARTAAAARRSDQTIDGSNGFFSAWDLALYDSMTPPLESLTPVVYERVLEKLKPHFLEKKFRSLKALMKGIEAFGRYRKIYYDAPDDVRAKFSSPEPFWAALRDEALERIAKLRSARDRLSRTRELVSLIATDKDSSLERDSKLESFLLQNMEDTVLAATDDVFDRDLSELTLRNYGLHLEHASPAARAGRRTEEELKAEQTRLIDEKKEARRRFQELPFPCRVLRVLGFGK